MSSCSPETGVVAIVFEDGRYSLAIDGVPYEVKGAGLEFGSLERLAAHGGNSFRTWRTHNAKAILDEAHDLGLTVIMCIEIGSERHGFNYDDQRAVAAQLEYARGEVQKYKDHPALLAWMIGNEPNLSFRNPKVFDAVNEISEMIHKVDGKHPTTMALAGFNAELAELVEQRSPDLDFISIQLYGAIVDLPRRVDEIGFDKPFMVTEWGTVGHWEVDKTEWGAPIERNSSDKADNFLLSYETAIKSMERQVLGSYVFLWGQKQERTPTWYGMFLADGAETEAIDVMHYIWTGEWPDNRAPRIESTLLDSKTAHESIVLESDGDYEASIVVSDSDNDPLEYRWEIMRESDAAQEGGDKEEIPEIIADRIDAPNRDRIIVSAPVEPGAYRLFAYVYDGNNNAGHANIPFYVQ